MKKFFCHNQIKASDNRDVPSDNCKECTYNPQENLTCMHYRPVDPFDKETWRVIQIGDRDE